MSWISWIVFDPALKVVSKLISESSIAGSLMYSGKGISSRTEVDGIRNGSNGFRGFTDGMLVLCRDKDSAVGKWMSWGIVGEVVDTGVWGVGNELLAGGGADVDADVVAGKFLDDEGGGAAGVGGAEVIAMEDGDGEITGAAVAGGMVGCGGIVEDATIVEGTDIIAGSSFWILSNAGLQCLTFGGRNLR